MTEPLLSRPWRYALASTIGSSHLRNGSPCQDASACEISEHAGASLLVSVVADGAGSAKRSQMGSRLACEVVRDQVRALVDAGGRIEDINRFFAERVLERFHVVVGRMARKLDAPPREFACTLLAAFVGPERSAFMQIGDGAIVISTQEARDRYEWVFWPQQGEYANETRFATGKNAKEDLLFAVRHGAVDELAMFSDGLQNMVLDYATQTAHAGFFIPMFQGVRDGEEGYSEKLSEALAGFLSSRSVLNRTDDDKSLILATRRVPEPPPALPRRAPRARHSALPRPSRGE